MGQAEEAVFAVDFEFVGVNVIDRYTIYSIAIPAALPMRERVIRGKVLIRRGRLYISAPRSAFLCLQAVDLRQRLMLPVQPIEAVLISETISGRFSRHSGGGGVDGRDQGRDGALIITTAALK